MMIYRPVMKYESSETYIFHSPCSSTETVCLGRGLFAEGRDIAEDRDV